MSEHSPTQESTSGYQVLARKYRPSTFEDMIGQEAMVKTLTNAFKTGRIAHAFMLTGVRGIGKTTTARLLARALNYETDSVKGPSVDFSVMGSHCESIMASSHMDVLEMDAASRTGVENMREMLDGVRYAPVSARYKVYIIDEVHMLSTGAFNALLKTLEEPPDHAKFVFATTEIHKVPITVLSRCQRFDLRRVEVSELSAHLKKICEQEKAQVSDEGLSLIARAAEGSVRDGLSLLDQAIVQRSSEDAQVSGEQVRDMLGLADRGRVTDLFMHTAKADAKAALLELREQYDRGADPAVVLRDMLDICHEVSRAKALGEGAAIDAAPDQITRLKALSDLLSMGQVTRIWQMLLKAYDDVKTAPTPLAAAEMALLRLCVASELPPPELAAQLLANPNAMAGMSSSAPSQSAGSASSAPASSSVSAPSTAQGAASAEPSATQQSSAPMAQIKPAPQKAPSGGVHFNSLQEIADYAREQGERRFHADIEGCIRLISFESGKIIFEPTPLAEQHFPNQLKEKLKEWTEQNWSIVIETAGPEALTLREINQREKREAQARLREHDDMKTVQAAFPNAQLLEIRERPALSSNVIAGKFRSKDSKT